MKWEVKGNYPYKGIPIPMLKGLMMEIVEHMKAYGFTNVEVKDIEDVETRKLQRMSDS